MCTCSTEAPADIIFQSTLEDFQGECNVTFSFRAIKTDVGCLRNSHILHLFLVVFSYLLLQGLFHDAATQLGVWIRLHREFYSFSELNDSIENNFDRVIERMVPQYPWQGISRRPGLPRTE